MDNIALVGGSIVGTQEVAGVHYQRLARSRTTSRTSVVSQVAEILLIAAAGNMKRSGVTVTNMANTWMSLGAGTAGVTDDSLTARLAPNGGYWETPFGYDGEVRAKWDAPSGGGAPAGKALITEFIANGDDN